MQLLICLHITGVLLDDVAFQTTNPQSKAPVTPNGNATAFVQRSKNLSACCGVTAKYALNYQICQL